jgi:sterol desaturase/sphingolipid hydroxylase (fatty acid hydroxylase superfamily)
MAAEVELKIGEGWISGYVAALLGLAALGGVLCFRFPEALTTAEMRAQYDPEVLREVLFWCLVVGSVSGAVNFLFAKGRRQAITGLAACGIAVLFGGAGIETTGRPASDLAIGLDWLILGLLVSAVVFIPIEKALAVRRQLILRKQWRTDLLYFAVNSLLISYIPLITMNAVPAVFGWAVSATVQDAVQAWPTWLQFVAAVFCADLAQYWTHRWYHTRSFWKIHAVHHSAPAMDWLAGSRLHILEILITRSSILGILFLVGFSEPALQAYIVLVGVQAVFIHANVGLDFGFLNYILATPQFHHWHHSDDRAAADTNFAVHLPVLDLMFGTFRLPRGEWPESYGVIGPPIPDGLIGQALYPFRKETRS